MQHETFSKTKQHMIHYDWYWLFLLHGAQTDKRQIDEVSLKIVKFGIHFAHTANSNVLLCVWLCCSAVQTARRRRTESLEKYQEKWVEIVSQRNSPFAREKKAPLVVKARPSRSRERERERRGVSQEWGISRLTLACRFFFPFRRKISTWRLTRLSPNVNQNTNAKKIRKKEKKERGRPTV